MTSKKCINCYWFKDITTYRSDETEGFCMFEPNIVKKLASDWCHHWENKDSSKDKEA